MNAFWEVVLDALIDTAKILPLLFIVYYVIELIEYKCATKLQRNKLLKGGASPVFGAVIGCVPQCGFSVVSTDLFSKGAISIGALIAVYIATSDEAIPIMFSRPDFLPYMFVLMAIKVVAGILVGYLTLLLHKILFKKKEQSQIEEHHNDEYEANLHGGCCHHHVETKAFDWLHPLLHCLKISAFILLINVLFGCVAQLWIGEERLAEFMRGGYYVQPLLAVLLGLIPNCASSVVLTELFLMGGISFGAVVAGLCVNAGIGLVILLKQNKNWKQNLFILSILIVSSLTIGYIVNLVMTWL